MPTGRVIYALARMLIQLLLIGYALTFIFESDTSLLTLLVLAVMLLASSWIALGAIPVAKKQLWLPALIAIVVGGGSVLALVTQVVLQLEPWYEAKFMIPLAGMIFAASMNSVSLAGERYYAEAVDHDHEFANRTAFNAALIPNINGLFAVGLVSLPGMMTGQILSGVDPLIAVRYQIMVMCMILGASGISASLFLGLRHNLGNSPD